MRGNDTQKGRAYIATQPSDNLTELICKFSLRLSFVIRSVPE